MFSQCWATPTNWIPGYQMLSMFSQWIPGYQEILGQPELHPAHQAAHFNLLWPNEIHIIGVMEEFETGATFTLPGPAFPPGAMYGMYGNSAFYWRWIGDELDMMLRNINRFSGISTCCQIWHRRSHFVSCIMPQNASSIFKRSMVFSAPWANWAKLSQVDPRGRTRWQCAKVGNQCKPHRISPGSHVVPGCRPLLHRLVTGRVSLSVPHRIIHRIYIYRHRQWYYVCILHSKIDIYILYSIYAPYIWWYTPWLSPSSQGFIPSPPAWECSFLWQRPTARPAGWHFVRWSFWWPPPAEDEHWEYRLQTGPWTLEISTLTGISLGLWTSARIEIKRDVRCWSSAITWFYSMPFSLLFESYLVTQQLITSHHHLPNHLPNHFPTQKTATKAPCRCGSNALGRPPRSLRCRCIWWRSAHSWGSQTQHLHLDLRRKKRKKWGENDGTPIWTTTIKSINHYEHLWTTGFREVPTHIPHFPHVTFDPGPPAKWVTPVTRSSEVPNSSRRGRRTTQRRPRGEPRKLRERWGSDRVSLEMIGPTENGKVSVRLWL